jgi:serine/threonine protein kinase
MEYIEHNLKNELRKRILPENIIKNIAKQLMYVVLQLWYQFKITHGDLHEGNILLDISESKVNTYKIGRYTRRLNTLGYEPILIDFQFASIYKYKNTNYTFNELIQRQTLYIMELFRYYISNFQQIYNNIAGTKTLEELLAVIDAI